MSEEYGNKNHNDQAENEIWNDIRKKTRDIKYGSITITLHDGKIVQVDTNTKTRY